MAPLIVCCSAGQCVHAVVLRMAAVALDPMPFDPVRLRGLDQLLPQLGILDRLLVRGAPAVALPVVDPARDSIADVDAVRMEKDPAGALQGFQTPDRSQ